MSCDQVKFCLSNLKELNVWVKKNETNRSSDTLLRFVSVFLTQTLAWFFSDIQNWLLYIVGEKKFILNVYKQRKSKSLLLKYSVCLGKKWLIQSIIHVIFSQILQFDDKIKFSNSDGKKLYFVRIWHELVILYG